MTTHTSVQPQMDAILNFIQAGDRTLPYLQHSAKFMKAAKELESAFDGNKVDAYRSVCTILRLEKDMTDFPALAPRLYQAAICCLEESRTEGSTTIFNHDAVALKLRSWYMPMESSFKGDTPDESDDVKVTPMADVKHWLAGAVPGFNEEEYQQRANKRARQMNDMASCHSAVEHDFKRPRFNNYNNRGNNHGPRRGSESGHTIACQKCKWYHPPGKCLMMCDGSYKRAGGKAPCNRVHPESLHIDTAPYRHRYCVECKQTHIPGRHVPTFDNN
ncbi:unnamed protein product [Ambrosiozyma monospora]|uniref:Unnamed protein product n=1 Tax=Ambrosiozyma monospora TaxID=43982 RepID=A0A9W7DG07_AMBMO|nr:unnamed protein product [Ambrosiozyma monospora]